MAAADAQTVLSDPCLGLSSNYPWPYMFATVATLLIFFIEFMLKKFYNWRTNHIAAAAAEQQPGKEVEAADADAVSTRFANAQCLSDSSDWITSLGRPLPCACCRLCGALPLKLLSMCAP